MMNGKQPQSTLYKPLQTVIATARPARLVAAWRAIHGLTLTEAAAELGCGRSTLGKIERGEAPAKTALHQTICRAVGIDPAMPWS